MALSKEEQDKRAQDKEIMRAKILIKDQAEVIRRLNNKVTTLNTRLRAVENAIKNLEQRRY